MAVFIRSYQESNRWRVCTNCGDYHNEVVELCEPCQEWIEYKKDHMREGVKASWMKSSKK